MSDGIESEHPAHKSWANEIPLRVGRATYHVLSGSSCHDPMALLELGNGTVITVEDVIGDWDWSRQQR